ncbi:hypothetical protein D3C72_2071170 [compost metagenome]
MWHHKHGVNIVARRKLFHDSFNVAGFRITVKNLSKTITVAVRRLCATQESNMQAVDFDNLMEFTITLVRTTNADHRHTYSRRSLDGFINTQ